MRDATEALVGIRDAARKMLERTPVNVAMDERDQLLSAIAESEKIVPPQGLETTLTKGRYIQRSIPHTFADEDKGWVVEVVISANIVPYVPASRDEPADGGYLEDESFEVTGFTIEIEGKDFYVAVGRQMKLALEAHVRKAYEADEDFRDKTLRRFMDLG